MNTNNLFDITLTTVLTAGIVGTLAIAGMGSAVILGVAATAGIFMVAK